MSVVIVTSVNYMPNDVAIVSGTVDGLAVSTQVWQSAVNTQPSVLAKLNFCATALKNAVPVVGVSQISLTGTVTV